MRTLLNDTKGVGSKGMFLNRLERALDLSKNGLEKRKGIWATAHLVLTEVPDACGGGSHSEDEEETLR